MTHEPLPHLLARIDLFSGVPESVLEDLADAGTTFSTPPGRRITTQGSDDAGLQVIVHGSAEVEVNGVRRSAMHPGDYFGEISVIDGHGRSATLMAGEEGVRTFAISPLNFAPLIDKHPQLARALLVALCARIRALEKAEAATAAP